MPKLMLSTLVLGLALSPAALLAAQGTQAPAQPAPATPAPAKPEQKMMDPATQPPEQQAGGGRSGNAMRTAQPVPAAGANPTLKFAKTTHDFGIVSDDKPVTEKFEFTNVSDRVITIKNVQTSCGCTTAPLTKRTFAPGESYAIDITFNPQNRRGKELKVVHVDTDDPNFPRYDLQINVDIRARVMMEPALVSFGMLRAGSAGSQVLTIIGRHPEFDVTEATVRDPRVSIERVERTRVTRDGDQLWQIAYRLSTPASLPMGQLRTYLDVKTNDPERAVLSLAVHGDVIGDLNVLPDRVQLQLSKAGDRWQREVRIEHRMQTPFEITAMDVEAPEGMEVVLDMIEDATPRDNAFFHRLRISGNTPAQAGRLTGKVVVSTNVAGMEKIEIPIAGMYNPVAGGAASQPAPLIAPATRPAPAGVTQPVPNAQPVPKKP